MNSQQQLEAIAEECSDYAKKHNCELGEAILDWEGDGPNGGWGLDRDTEYEVARILGIENQFGTNNEY